MLLQEPATVKPSARGRVYPRRWAPAQVRVHTPIVKRASDWVARGSPASYRGLLWSCSTHVTCEGSGTWRPEHTHIDAAWGLHVRVTGPAWAASFPQVVRTTMLPGRWVLWHGSRQPGAIQKAGPSYRRRPRGGQPSPWHRSSNSQAAGLAGRVVWKGSGFVRGPNW